MNDQKVNENLGKKPIEYNNSVFKNRPFSSENKYSYARRNNLPHISKDQIQKHPENDNENDNPFRDHDMISEAKSVAVQGVRESQIMKKNNGLFLPPINKKKNALGPIITEDIDMDNFG